MNAARLEELAVWAETNSDWCGRHGMAEVNANLRDHARCARAWANFDKMVRAQRGYSLDVWMTNKRGIRMVTNDRTLNGPTAIEAVEAAEVKP